MSAEYENEERANVAILCVSILALVVSCGLSAFGIIYGSIEDIAIGLFGAMLSWWGILDTILVIKNNKKKDS